MSDLEDYLDASTASGLAGRALDALDALGGGGSGGSGGGGGGLSASDLDVFAAADLGGVVVREVDQAEVQDAARDDGAGDAGLEDDREEEDYASEEEHGKHRLFQVQELGASFSSLSHAHEELMRLSEGLQIKARMLAERENQLASQRLEVEQAQLEIEERHATLARREAVMDERLVEEERMMLQDAKLVQQRLRDSVQEELATAKDKLHTQRESLMHKLARAQKLARQRAKQVSNADDRIRLLTEKNRRLESRAADLELEMARQTNELDRVRAELDNARKKFRVESWRRQRSQTQRQEEAASADARRANETQHARSRSSMEFAQDRQMLMLLADGLADALLSRSSAGSGPLSEDLFVHKLLPGLAHALHLLEPVASGQTTRRGHGPEGDHTGAGALDAATSAARDQRERLLALVMFCLQGVEMLERPRSQASGGRRADDDRTRTSMVHRFASRLLKSVPTPVVDDPRGIGQLEMLSAQVVLGMQMVKKPLEPLALLAPLRVMCRGVATAEGCELVLRFPVSLEPALRVLYFTGHAAWRPCVREAALLLMALSRKGEYQAKFLFVITRATHFADACEAVLTTLRKLETHETDRDFTDCACEAASIVAVILQRLSRTDSGVDFVCGIFRDCDLAGLLAECRRVAASLGSRTSDVDSLEFFQVNAQAVENALKARLRREQAHYDQATVRSAEMSSENSDDDEA